MDSSPLSSQRSINNSATFLKKTHNLDSKPSSVTTACTYAPNEMSATKSVCSHFGSSHKKRRANETKSQDKSTAKKENNKNKNENSLLGTKRSA